MSHNRDKTHCRHGHAFSPENTRTRVLPKKTYRTCLACERIRNKRWSSTEERRLIVAWLVAQGLKGAARNIANGSHLQSERA